MSFPRIVLAAQTDISKGLGLKKLCQLAFGDPQFFVQMLKVKRSLPKNIAPGHTKLFHEVLSKTSWKNDTEVNSHFGGKTNSEDRIENVPVILVHGLSLKAFGVIEKPLGGTSGGWLELINELMASGYKKQEIYAPSLDFSRPEHAFEKLKEYVFAVKEHTGARKVDLVAHSFGCVATSVATVSEKIDYGPGIGKFVRRHIMLAGAALGAENAKTFWAPFIYGAGPARILSPGADLPEKLKFLDDWGEQQIITLIPRADSVLGYGSASNGKIPGARHITIDQGHFGARAENSKYIVQLLKENED